ncbi:MAG: methionyl-tRNA formyltransferase [Patescibacteria group bacterium]|nr:methionyl-tRNA formyltransferase [Patescibacteria group bacterium]
MTSSKTDKKIIFWGTPEFSLASLKSLDQKGWLKLVVTQPDRPAGRGLKELSSPVKKYCLENELKFLAPEKLDQEFIFELKKYLPALFVVVAYGKIIPKEILDLSYLPAVNIHPSRLPELRGPSPIQTAIFRGFEATAVSLMQLDEKMDHGPILGQIEAKIEPNEAYGELSERLAVLGAELLEQKIEPYLNGQLKAQAQDHTQATYCRLLKKEEGKIDWHKSAQEIHNQVRAFNPWPSAFCRLADLEVKIIKSEVVDKELPAGNIFFDKKNIIIGTAEKSLKILTLQPFAKKIMTAEEFIRGYQKYLT